MNVSPSCVSADNLNWAEKPVWLLACETEANVVLSSLVASVPLRGEKKLHIPEFPRGNARMRRAGSLSGVLVLLI